MKEEINPVISLSELKKEDFNKLNIGFIKQSIGHRTLDTTSAYINKLSD